MFFQVYGENSFYQLLGFVLVFTGLILLNEFARRSEFGGIFSFVILPILLSFTGFQTKGGNDNRK